VAPNPPPGQGMPWCAPCEIWLVHDEVTDEWISFAEHAGRRPAYQRRQAIAATREIAVAAAPAVSALLPTGWHSHLGEPAHGGRYTLDLHPPARSTRTPTWCHPSAATTGGYGSTTGPAGYAAPCSPQAGPSPRRPRTWPMRSPRRSAP
jgi:hypothetical protein